MNLSFHYLLMANQAMVQKELLSRLTDTPLSLGQPKILDYLNEHNGANQKEIAMGCHIEPPTLTSLLSRMEETGLIERRIENNNRRTLYVYITPKGKSYQKRVLEEFQKIEEIAFEGFSEDETEYFMKNYIQIFNNLKKKRGIE